MKATFKCSTLSNLPNLVVIADMVLKRKFSKTFSFITVQFWIFTSLDRNDLIVVIKNFRDTSLYECQSLIFSHLLRLSCIRHPVCDTSCGHIGSLMRYLLATENLTRRLTARVKGARPRT